MEGANLLVIICHQKLCLQKEDIFKIGFFLPPPQSVFKNTSGNGSRIVTFQNNSQTGCVWKALLKFCWRSKRTNSQPDKWRQKGRERRLAFPWTSCSSRHFKAILNNLMEYERNSFTVHWAITEQAWHILRGDTLGCNKVDGLNLVAK